MKTAGEAGWRQSRYNLIEKIPGTELFGVANIYKGSFGVYDPGELYLLSVAEQLDENHPILEKFRSRGLIVDFDELETILAESDPAFVGDYPVTLTVSVTQACNFDCAYCFEYHRGKRMAPETQDEVVALAKRMLDASGRRRLHIIWFGGEPLLAPDIIESMSQKFMAVCAARKAVYSACIVTNGYLFTQEIVDMLAKYRVESAIVGLDGVGKIHDDGRPLKGGGPTFERIAENLRTLRFPFTVSIRQVVHSHNLSQVEELRSFVRKLAEESGNRITHNPDLAYDFVAPEKRALEVSMIGSEDASRVGVLRDSARFIGARGHHCGANSLWCAEIHSTGALHKCWPAIDHPELSYGTARDWDPADPYATASAPDKLKLYLDTNVCNNGDEECRECIWLPFCAGGCPYLRAFYQKECLQYRNDPEQFILGLYRRLKGGDAAVGGGYRGCSD